MPKNRVTPTIKPTFLAVRWTTSRGRDTYGYNICTVTDQETGKRFRCNGGGYDMLGTSFGAWMADTYQTHLLAIKNRAYTRWTETHTGPWDQEQNEDGLYGMSYYVTGDRVVLDGACGISSMETIAKTIGIKLSRTWDRKGNTTGYIVSAARFSPGNAVMVNDPWDSAGSRLGIVLEIRHEPHQALLIRDNQGRERWYLPKYVT